MNNINTNVRDLLSNPDDYILKIEKETLSAEKKSLFPKIRRKKYDLKEISQYFFVHIEDFKKDPLFPQIYTFFQEKIKIYNQKHRNKIELLPQETKKVEEKIPENPIIELVFSNAFITSLILLKTGNPSLYASVNNNFYKATKNGIAHKEVLKEFSNASGLLSDLLVKKKIPEFNENEENCVQILKAISIEIIQKAKLYSGYKDLFQQTKPLSLFDKLSRISAWTEDSILTASFYTVIGGSIKRADEIRNDLENGSANSIQKLSLCGKGLYSLPKEIKYFTNLQELNLSSNKLQEIPKEIVHFRFLQVLKVGSNQIKEFTKEICDLGELQELNLSNNQITEIPSEVGKLTKLQLLDLAKNKLKKIPIEIAKIAKLEKFDLSYNPLEKIPYELNGRIIFENYFNLYRIMEKM